jgi:hypothetical protein
MVTPAAFPISAKITEAGRALFAIRADGEAVGLKPSCCWARVWEANGNTMPQATVAPEAQAVGKPVFVQRVLLLMLLFSPYPKGLFGA